MDLQTSKVELVKMILSIENQSVLDKIMHLLKSEKSDFWLDLSQNERKNIQLGINQLNKGEGIELKDFVKKVS